MDEEYTPKVLAEEHTHNTGIGVEGSIVESTLDEAVKCARASIEEEIATKLEAPSEVSTRFILTKYILLATVVLSLAVMAASALKVSLPEIVTGVVLMGMFGLLNTAVLFYFEARKEQSKTKALLSSAQPLQSYTFTPEK